MANEARLYLKATEGSSSLSQPSTLRDTKVDKGGGTSISARTLLRSLMNLDLPLLTDSHSNAWLTRLNTIGPSSQEVDLTHHDCLGLPVTVFFLPLLV